MALTVTQRLRKVRNRLLNRARQRAQPDNNGRRGAATNRVVMIVAEEGSNVSRAADLTKSELQSN